MAAPRDGEPLNFKSFVARKKTEYSLRFPFLTERQILAKLRRVWECQKSSRNRKREPVIDSPHAPHRVPITTTSKRGRNEKSDLSAFDIDCDTIVPCQTHYTGRYSKCYKSTRPAESSLPNQLHITEHLSDTSFPSLHQLCRGDETTRTDSNVPQMPVLPDKYTQRQPLQPLQVHVSTPALPTNPLTNNSTITSPTISPHVKSSLCTCTILCRKEAPVCQYCTINTLPFSSREARHEHGVAMRNGKTQIPVMANRITWCDLNHVSSRRERGIRDFEAGLHKAGSPSQFRDSTLDMPSENTKSGTEDVLSGQSVSPREDTRLTPVSGSPAIQSLPNLSSDTDDRESTALGSTPLDDTITTITAFDSPSRGINGTPSSRNRSNSPPHDSEVSIVPLSSNSDTLRDNQIISPPSRTPASTRPPFQRYRLKRRSRTRLLWLCDNRTASCSSECSVGQFHDENTHIDSATDMHQCSMYGDGEGVNPKKKQKLSGDCAVEFHENNSEGSSRLFSATDGEMEKHRQALEQIVPEDTIPLPQDGCPTYSSDHQQQEGSARPNVMCDMFQLLTPDRPTVEPHKDGACLGSDGGVPSSSATSRRRVFRSATTESKSNFYSMFMDESDIFM